MKKMAILLIALILVSVVFLSGCNEHSSNNENLDCRFFGTWVYPFPTTTMTFSSNGGCSYSKGALDMHGIWEINGNKLILKFNNGITIMEFEDYYFSEGDTILNLKQEGINYYYEYEKQ